MTDRDSGKESFLPRSDINFETWSIFTTRKHGRNRILQRTNGKGLTQAVQIIPWLDNGKPHTLTACECKVLYALFNMWRNAGRPAGKPVFFSFKRLAGELGLRWSGNTLEHMKRWLLNLRGVMI